jgi:hypothetical protein
VQQVLDKAKVGRSPMKRRAIALLLAASAIGCRAADRGPADSTRVATGVAATPASPWAVSDSGAGPLHIGMTLVHAAKQLRVATPDTSNADPACAYLALGGVPKGLRLMWVSGRLARIEVADATLPTDRGARVGDTHARIDSLYRELVTVSPHKYDPRASYLIVRSPVAADSTLRLVFETDSTQRVARYRAGREPEVEWVEGCA